MNIPKYHEFMLPIIKLLSCKKAKTLSEIRDSLAKEFQLTPEEQKELLPSGTQTVFYNRVGWAITYLKKAKLLESPSRGVCKITSRGLELLSNETLTTINSKFLKKYDEFLEFQNISKDQDKNTEEEGASEDTATPIESLEKSYNEINDDLKSEVLDQIFSCSPFFFEKLVIDLLINLGYGGSRREAGQAFATTNDEGIDGVIKEDRLGLDLIYVQAKRWKSSSSVGRPEIQKFAGALQGKRAKKGVFITTSYFSSGARDYAKNIDSKIILIDGRELSSLMIESNTGVSLESRFEIKKIDFDYFSE